MRKKISTFSHVGEDLPSAMGYKVLTLKNLGLSWVLLLVSIGLAVLEANLTYPLTIVTNGLWVLCVVGLVFFMAKGICYLRKYFQTRSR